MVSLPYPAFYSVAYAKMGCMPSTAFPTHADVCVHNPWDDDDGIYMHALKAFRLYTSRLMLATRRLQSFCSKTAPNRTKQTLQLGLPQPPSTLQHCGGMWRWFECCCKTTASTKTPSKRSTPPVFHFSSLENPDGGSATHSPLAGPTSPSSVASHLC